MANTIGSLVIDLVANTATFSTTLSKAVSEVESTVLKMKTAFGTLGSVFSLAGIAELTKSTVDFGDELAKSAIKTGTTAQAISELAFAARQVNIDLPELTSSFEKMEKAISTAGTGNRATTDAFNALGISFEQISKLSPDQQFEEIANQISKLPDPTDRARASIAIFGKAGAELLPLFEQGAEGIELARQKAIDFGASLDADQIKKLADASTAVKDLGESFKILALTLASKAAPAMKQFLDSLTSAVTGNEGEFLERRLTTLQALFDKIPSDDPGNTLVGNFLQGKILQAEQQIAGLKLAKQIKDGLASGSSLTDNTPPGFQQQEIQPIDIKPNLKIQTDKLQEFYDGLIDATKTGAEKLADAVMQADTNLELLYDAGIISAGDFARRQSAAADTASLSTLMATNQAQIGQGIKQSTDDLKESYKSISDASKLATENMKVDFDKTKNNAMQAAQSIEDSFATFLVDPFQGGLKKMLQSWIQTIDQMVAKAAAQSIFKSLFGGSGGLGSIFQGFLSGGGSPSGGSVGGGTTPAVPLASGGSFNVGGSGSTDSQLVHFMATPGEKVTVTPLGQQAQMGGIILHQTVNIDARSDAAQIRQMIGQSTQYAIQQSTAWMVNKVKRGAFAQ
jgi:hypothetical protein